MPPPAAMLYQKILTGSCTPFRRWLIRADGPVSLPRHATALHPVGAGTSLASVPFRGWQTWPTW